MPPSTPVPAFHLEDLHDTDPDELRDFDTTEPMGPPDSCGSDSMGCDSKPVTAVADRVKVLTRGALGHPRIPYLDNIGEQDSLLDAFVRGRGNAAIPALPQNSQDGAGFDIDLSSDPDGEL